MSVYGGLCSFCLCLSTNTRPACLSLRRKGKKKAINRKEEYEEKEEYEAILGAGNEEGLKQKEEYEGKEEYEERRSAGHHCFVLDKQIGHQDTWTGVLPKNVYLERSRLREAAV